MSDATRGGLPYLPGVAEDRFDAFRSGCIYQVFPDRFAREPRVPADRPLQPWDAVPDRESFHGGNLPGITSRLPYLADLGVRTLYLNPVFRARSNHRYDTEDYFVIDPLLGSNDDLRKLCEQARARGIGVLLDGVFNHTGREFEQFHLASMGDARARSWYSIYDDGTYQTFGGADALPKLDNSHPAVLAFVEAVLRFWDGYGISGWRFDVPYKVPQPFWEALFKRVADLPSARFVIAEAWQEWTFAEPFASLQNYRFGSRIHDYIHRRAIDAEDLTLEVARWAASRADASLLANHIDSHDTQRFMRACEGNRESFALGFALHMMLPGIPLVYYGTEFGMDGGNDPDCRRPYPLLLDMDQQEMLSVTVPFMRLRGRHHALSHGSFEVRELKNHAFVAVRATERCAIEFAVNAGDREELLNADLSGNWVGLCGEVRLERRVPARSLQYRLLHCEC